MKKNKKGSISARLNLWYTVLMGVLSVGLILSVVTAARMAENAEAQQNLVRSVERNIDEIEVENGLLDIESDFAYRNGGIYAIVYNTDGSVLGGEYPEVLPEEIPLEQERFDKFFGYYIYDSKIEFTKYDYKIDAIGGDIISSEVEGLDYYTPYEGGLDFYGENCTISCKDAFDTVMEKSGLDTSTIELINVKSYEYNGAPIYEIEFYSSEKAYDDIWVRGVIKANGLDGVWAVLVRLATILLPLYMIVCSLVGRLITKRALEPVHLLSEAVEEIHSGKDLTKRVDVGETDPLILALSDNFNEMFSRLQFSFESERQFSGDVSHELRTPTCVILAECEYQLSRQELDAEAQEGFEGIQKQAESMKTLISQLLDITRLEQQQDKPEFQREDFAQLINAVCDDALTVNKKSITIERDIDPVEMNMDIMLMTRLVSNLIGNAIIYGKENGRILVTLKETDGKILLAVKDDGIGIAAEHIDSIWNRFYRVDKARCREQGCSGLGLPMVRQIADLHGGRAYVESELGKGSTFYVEF